MKLHVRTRPIFRVGIGLLVLGSAAVVSAQEPRRNESPSTGRSGVQKRTYDFKEAGKEMEYSLFVPSKYDKSKKPPLIVALHGLGGSSQQMIRSQGLTQQAEKYGYIVVAPMGYNSSGWYGSRGMGAGAGAGRAGGSANASPPPGAVLTARERDALKLSDDQKKQFDELQKEADSRVQKILTDGQNKQLKDIKDNPGRAGGGAQDSPSNLGELSEKDVMNVLEIVRKDFNIDEKRAYLIGHSMGGAGTWHIGTKYADTWAGLAPIAPAAFGQPTGLDKLKHIPVIVVQGDNDTLVPATGTRRWVAKLKDLGVTHEYVEIPGAGHGDVVGKGMAKIFEFFEAQQEAKNKEK